MGAKAQAPSVRVHPGVQLEQKASPAHVDRQSQAVPLTLPPASMVRRHEPWPEQAELQGACEGEAEGVGVHVGLQEGVGVHVGVQLGVGVMDGVFDVVGVGVVVERGEAPGLKEDDGVGCTDTVADAVPDDVGDGVWDGD